MRRVKITSSDDRELRGKAIDTLDKVNEALETGAYDHVHPNLPFLDTLSETSIDVISDVSADDAIEELYTQPQQW